MRSRAGETLVSASRRRKRPTRCAAPCHRRVNRGDSHAAVVIPDIDLHRPFLAPSSYFPYVCMCGHWASSAAVASAQLQVQ